MYQRRPDQLNGGRACFRGPHDRRQHNSPRMGETGLVADVVIATTILRSIVANQESKSASKSDHEHLPVVRKTALSRDIFDEPLGKPAKILRRDMCACQMKRREGLAPCNLTPNREGTTSRAQ